MLPFKKVLVILILMTNLLLGQSFTFNGPSEVVLNWGQMSKTVTFSFTYFNTGGLVSPHLITKIDDQQPFPVPSGGSSYMPSSLDLSLSPGNHTIIFTLVSLSTDPQAPWTVHQQSSTGVLCKITVIIKNIFDGGSIYVDNYTVPKTSPFYKPGSYNIQVPIGAIDQDYQNYNRKWNTSENNLSLWDRERNQNGIWVPVSPNRNFNYTVVEDDKNKAIVRAGLRKNFRINQVNQTESDGNPTSQSYIVEQNSGQISTQGNGYTPGTIPYNFVYWTDNLSTSTIRTITPSDNSTYTALYKYPHLSNQTNAYSNPSQRRFIQTPDGVKHICYESMGKVWYELSTDGGSTWIMGNGGKPLSASDAKNPSMSFYANQISIVWQEKSGSSFKIKIALFWMNNYQSSLFGTVADDDIGLDYSYNANPVIACGYGSKAVVVWSGFNFCSDPGGSIGLRYAYGNVSYYGISWPTLCSILNTDENSVNPTITANYSVYTNPFNYHIAWEQVVNSSTSKINYCKLYSDQNNNLFNSTIEEASLNSGYAKNYKPRIELRKVSVLEYVYVTWLGYRTSPSVQTRVLMRNKSTSWSVIGAYGGNEVQNFSINKGTTIISNTEPIGLSWSEPNGPSLFYNKLLKYPGTGTIIILNTTGKDLQINNSVNFNDMFVNSFHSTTLPYNFALSQNFGTVSKENSVGAFNGREGVVGKNGAQFFFALGDISVNGQNINFISVPDSVNINSLEAVNDYFVSEPFTVNESTNLIYGVEYGMVDSILCSNLLTENKQISFKLELLDNQTNEVLGVFDEVTYSEQNVYQYNNLGYQVNLNGIGNRTIKFRLVVNTNTDLGFSLSNRVSDQSLLAKSNYQTVNYRGKLAVTEYALEQNYPNPFNPSTTIKFQLPKDGFVTLKVYDILGKEITTLLNEEKSQGKYEVTFDASNLSSGVYIYKLQAGDFVNSKKMLMIK